MPSGHPGNYTTFTDVTKVCNIAGVAMRQIQREEVCLSIDPADHHNGFAKVGLGMIERNEHLAISPPVVPNIVLDDRVAAGKPMFVTELLEDPLGRMALLARPVSILRKPLVDDPGEAVQLRTLSRHRPPVTGGTENAKILRTLSRDISKCRAASRELMPSA